MVDAVAGELPRASVGEDKVTLDASVDDLDDDLLVGEANDQAVLGGVAASQSLDLDFITNMAGYVLLVLRLGDQPLAGVVCAIVNTVFALQSGGLCSQSVLPSLRRRYLTWKREKYASDLTFLTKGI